MRNDHQKGQQSEAKTTVNSDQEIMEEVEEKKRKLLDLKINLRLGKLKNPNEIRALRKEIARLKTKLSLSRFVRGVKR